MPSPGRPSKYIPELAANICERLAAGESLRAVCRSEGMPPESTVRGWALDDVEGFSAQYARAREIGCYAMADELREIADTPQQGVKTKMMPEGKTEETWGDMIEHRRLQVDARKWLLSKMLPATFGDKLAVDQTTDMTIHDAIDRPPHESREQWMARRARELGDPIGKPQGNAD